MTQLEKPDQNKNEASACGKNHLKIAVGLCLIPLITPLFSLAFGQHGQESSDLTLVFIFLGIYLFALGVALWEAVDLMRSKGLSSCCRKGRVAVAAGLYLTPWALPFAFLILGPGFIMPFFHNLIVVLVLIATMLWQTFGFILLIRAKSSMRSFLAILFFILPASFVIMLFPLIGPAAVTIINAFCQISKR